LQTRREAEWCPERPALVLTSHFISRSHRCKRCLVLPTLSPAWAYSKIIICQVITTSAAKSLQTASSFEVRYPRAARHMPRFCTLRSTTSFSRSCYALPRTTSLRHTRKMESRRTVRGFEPLLAEPNGFLSPPLNHSVTLPCRIGLCPNSAMREANIPKHFARATHCAPLLSVFVLVKMLYTRPRAGTNPVCRSNV